MKKYKDDENKQKMLLYGLEKFVMQDAVGNVVKTKAYPKLCRQFIREPTNIKRNRENQKSVEEGLKKLTSKEATLILFWLELYRRYKDPNCDIKELKYTYSLEHIMPRKWREYWSFESSSP